MVTNNFSTVITVALGWLTLIINNRLKRKEKRETEIQSKKREVLQKMLDLHSERATGKWIKNDGWNERFEEMRKNIIVWASDEVLQEYAIFCEKFDPKGVEIIEKYEEHFGNAVLAFRKEIGYKNKHNCITARQIVLIFKSGWGHKL